MTSPWWKAGCGYGATAVILGAFGAHGLRNRISDPSKLASWSTAAQYQVTEPHLPSQILRANKSVQLIHSVALLVAEQAAPKNTVAKGLFAAGMTMFSGSIYLLILNPGLKFLGPVTPVGGLCMIAGWAVLAFGSRERLELE